MQMLTLKGIPASLDCQPELPSVEDFISSLRECREAKDLECTDRMHKNIHSHGLESSSVLGNHLVPVYVHCGNVVKARQVFHKLIKRNEHSWTSLIQGHHDSGEFERALEIFEKMQGDCVQPSKFTLHAVLRACACLKYIDRVRETHLDITKKGIETDSFVSVSLVDVYAKCGLLLDAQAVSSKLSARNEATWNALIAAYSDQGLLDEVLNCLQEMQSDGVAPDAIMLVHALKACTETGFIDKGQELHTEIVQGEYDSHLFLGNSLVVMYIKSNLLVEARAVLEDMPTRDVVSWTTLMAGYAEQGLGAEVLNCLEQMLIDGLNPNDVTYICVIKACSCIGALHKGQEIHAEIALEGYEHYCSVGTCLMDMYSKCGLVQEVWQAFEDLALRDVISWNVLIATHAESDHNEEALRCFVQMQKEGVVANAATFSSILKSCCNMGCLAKGRELYKEIAIEGFESDPFVSGTLVDMFAKCGCFTEAQDVLDNMPVRNVVAWTALIAGYSDHGLAVEAMRCLNQMQSEHVLPNAATFVSTIKACSTLEVMEKGLEIHMDIVKGGFEDLPHIGCSLIDMYTKFNLPSEALHVFNEIQEEDSAASWNALMVGHVEYGAMDEVLDLFDRMQLQGVAPDASTYLCGLRVCGSTGANDKGRALHIEIIKRGLEGNCFVGNTLVDMYAKCGSLAEALAVFEELPKRDIIPWNALIVGYAEHKFFEEAIIFLEQVHHEGICADMVSFLYTLKACSCTEAVGKGKELHAELVKLGLEDDQALCNTLVDMYVTCDALAEAQDVFCNMSSRDVFSWNALIGGHVEHMQGEEALLYLEEMHSEGTFPNDATFTAALKACYMVGDLDKGNEIHASIAKGGLENDPLVGKALVEFYCRCGHLLEAEKIFDDLSFGDTALWNAMCAGYAQHGHEEEVLNSVEQMELEGVTPDPITYDHSLKACSGLRALRWGREIHSAIIKKGFEGDALANKLLQMYVHCGSLLEAHEILSELLIQDAVLWDALIAVYAKHGLDKELLHHLDTVLLKGGMVSLSMFVCGLKACSNKRAIGKGQELHVEVIKEAFENNSQVSNVLVYMYAKCGLLAEAREVFDDKEVQDVVSWTSLMAGCVEHGCGHEALICLEQMQSSDVLANAFTYVCALKACNTLGLLGKGREIHADIVAEGFETDQYVCSNLVDLYAKCGSIVEAEELFDNLASGTVVSWNIMITHYTDQGRNEGALDCLEQMLVEGVCPNAVTYVCSLKACGSIGAIDKGRELHLEIVIAGFEWDSFVGNTLVDMYAKCGALLEASEIFDELLVKNIVSWTALIAGYSSRGQSELTFDYFERMLNSGVQPDGITLLSVLSLCSHAGFVEKGLEYFNSFSQAKGIRLTVEHYNCVVDLLSRAGQLKECLSMIERMPCPPNYVTWRTLLGACRKWGNVQFGKHAFNCAMRVDGMQVAACILMYNIYVDANMWEEAMKIDMLRANIQGRTQSIGESSCGTQAGPSS